METIQFNDSEYAQLSLFEKVVYHHNQADNYREQTCRMASHAINHAITAGLLLIQQKDSMRHGSFLDWFDEESKKTSTCLFSYSTAKNYMRVARFAQNNPELSFGTLKEYYVACGIMPPPESRPHEERERPTFTLKFRATKPMEEWPQSEQLEFIEMARPIVERYQALLSSNPSLWPMLN